MLIRFTKSRNGPVLTCVREDGSVTGVKPRDGAFFIRHDLMQYAVETTLRLREGFYGMVAGGRSIESFREPGVARTLPIEAVQTEFIVGLLDQIANFGDQTDTRRFNETPRGMLEQADVPRFAQITDSQLQAILRRFGELYQQFHDLPIGDTIELPFTV